MPEKTVSDQGFYGHFPPSADSRRAVVSTGKSMATNAS